MKTMKQIGAFAFLMIGLSIASYAEENLVTAFPAAKKAPAAPQAPAGMDPAMMEKMKTLMAPNENHKVLEQFIGKWNYTGKFWMTPDAPPQEMTGTAQNGIMYGGRFLKQDVEGPWMGETFMGLGFTGYDNIKKQYETVWIDSMATGMMTTSGQYDPVTKTLSQSGANSCPMTGETARPMRSTWTVIDKDHSTYTSYMNGPDGQEFKAMELNYTRAS